MKPIGNIFGFDCVTCEHNRHCYGGNVGNQFRYCQKSAEKIQNLDNLEKQNKQLKDDLNMLKDDFNKLKEYIRKNIIYDDVGMKILDPSPLEDYIQALEQGSDSK